MPSWAVTLSNENALSRFQASPHLKPPLSGPQRAAHGPWMASCCGRPRHADIAGAGGNNPRARGSLATGTPWAGYGVLRALPHRGGVPARGTPHGWVGWLWGGGVGPGSSEDVGVAKGRRAVHVGGGWCGGRVLGQRGPPGVDGRAHGAVADVVPDRRAIGPGGGRVHIVAQELGLQVVLGRGPRITDGAAVQLGPPGRRPPWHRCWRAAPPRPDHEGWSCRCG